MISIGAIALKNAVFVAPMAGITDRPFRRLARRYGAGLAVSEMVTSRPDLAGSRKTRLRLAHEGEEGPVSVQIAGADPAMMAEAARRNVDAGADIIDINMGCPAKKVCNVEAGSALLANEPLAARILAAVVAAVAVPVTLKIRTGPAPESRNAVRVARMAEDSGIRLVAIHGRTRACRFSGAVEYDTIAEVKSRVRIPVIANGDIATGEDARRVLDRTGADGVMIGRAAHGRPWIFRAIAAFLERGECVEEPPLAERRDVLLEHLRGLHELYGEPMGVRIARKHIAWALAGLPGTEMFRRIVNSIDQGAAQAAAVAAFFAAAGDEAQGERLAA